MYGCICILIADRLLILHNQEKMIKETMFLEKK